MGFWDGSGMNWTICKQSPAHLTAADNHIKPHNSIFKRLDALPGAQPTVSKN